MGTGAVFGIGTVDSADVGDVAKYDWGFTISYNNTAQGRYCEVIYNLAATSEAKLFFMEEDPPGTYVSLFFLVYAYSKWMDAGIVYVIQPNGVYQCRAPKLFCANSYCIVHV